MNERENKKKNYVERTNCRFLCVVKLYIILYYVCVIILMFLFLPNNMRMRISYKVIKMLRVYYAKLYRIVIINLSLKIYDSKSLKFPSIFSILYKNSFYSAFIYSTKMDIM